MTLHQELEWLAQLIWEDDGGAVREAHEQSRPNGGIKRSWMPDERQSRDRSAIVITHTGAGDKLVEMPWLDSGYNLDYSDWVMLSNDGWRALVEGESAIWEALERKLLVSFYVSQPDLIAVIGHRSGRPEADPDAGGHGEVRQLVGRIRSLLLPTAVVGFWADDSGALLDVLDLKEDEALDRIERELVH
jgi:hypothetical protein